MYVCMCVCIYIYIYIQMHEFAVYVNVILHVIYIVLERIYNYTSSSHCFSTTLKNQLHISKRNESLLRKLYT